MYISENTNIMQLRSRDRTAPQSLKKSLRKNGHTFLAGVILLYWYNKIQNIRRYKTALGDF